MSCDGFFLAGHKEFGSLLITDCTSAVNIIINIKGVTKFGFQVCHSAEQKRME
jgi:hypothetical protein